MLTRFFIMLIRARVIMQNELIVLLMLMFMVIMLMLMLTRLEERARVKCDQYWPMRGTETYGVMCVTLTDTQVIG